MQLSVTGHHVEVTAAMRSYVEKKLDRIVRHFDHVIDMHCVLTVEKLHAQGRSHAARARRDHPCDWPATATCMPPSTRWPTSSTAA